MVVKESAKTRPATVHLVPVTRWCAYSAIWTDLGPKCAIYTTFFICYNLLGIVVAQPPPITRGCIPESGGGKLPQSTALALLLL